MIQPLRSLARASSRAGRARRVVARRLGQRLQASSYQASTYGRVLPSRCHHRGRLSSNNIAI
ncbi:MAG TPA: hypothetical protein VIH49_04420, partial [Solirubrobacteraceae bacterium]